MNFGDRAKRRKAIRLGGGRNADQYPHCLQFYSVPPTENISLQEFEDFAVERLKVLKALENVGLKHIKGSADYKDAITKELKNLKTQGIMKGMTARYTGKELSDDVYDERRKDHISHFILRLAYCRSEELRRWFLAQEVDLFRHRFCQEDDKSIEIFLENNRLNYKPISVEKKNEIISDLAAAAPPGSSPPDIINYYKVPFTEALDLVKNRRVFLRDGNAYVPHNELIVIILSVFRARLSQALTVTSRALPQLEEDARLLPMLSGLSKRYLGQDYANKKTTAGTVTADMVDGHSQKSFPLCMQSIHLAFRKDHHLRHWGRQQYGLFLKGIGLSLDEAMKFWRSEFTKLMDGDKFDKQYSYNIRHNYGKEGKRANYTPYSCVKVITSNAPGPGDNHGCPFKHSDVDNLKQRLQGLSMSKDMAEELVQDVKGGHYGLACGKYFNFKHNSSIGFVPSHPNEYFDTSLKMLSGEISADGLPTQTSKPSLMFSQPEKLPQKKSQNVKATDDFDDELTLEDISNMESLP